MTELNHTRQQEQFKVLLIGDSCTDQYNIGTVDRLSPEAPVPVVKIVDSYTIPGMAANVNLNLQNLGINADFVTNSEENIKCRYIDKRSGQHLIRVDSDPFIKQWDGQIPHPLESYDAIIISDYNKGFLSYGNIEHIIKAANCPVFIDTKKTDLEKFSASWVYLKINETEYRNLTSIPMNLIVTLGDKGAMLKNLCCEEVFPTQQVEVMDVCGCGDTFLAALTSQYLFTNSIEKAIMFANVAAGLTVQHRGNYAPSYDEIRND
jgi:D-beta-D-heptose 7-phosphate kinase/D-beta-D-heptose 1-phosphate adenosyltransferase